MAQQLYPAFETALLRGDFDELRRLYTIEHELRVRIEGQNQALIYSAAHGTQLKASAPGFLMVGTDREREEGATRTKPKPTTVVKPKKPMESSDDMEL